MGFQTIKKRPADALTTQEIVFLQNLALEASYDSSNVALISDIGAGIAFETPSGTIDDSNQSFTVANTPLYIVVNGTQYFENVGFTRTLLALTLSFPVGTGGWIRSAYSPS